MGASISIRSLARELDLSPATISDALRGTGRVHPTTVQRVRTAAERVGYRINPLTTALMSDLRRSRATTFRGVMAVVEINEPQRGPHGPFPREIVNGAMARAEALGFRMEEFAIGPGGLSINRLDSVLRSRGIHAIMLLPAWYPPDLSGLTWSQFAAVYTDCFMERPPLHLVCTDHYRSMTELLALLFARGYRRPGLVLEKGRDERLQLRQSAAFRAFQESHRSVTNVPILYTPDYSPGKFLPWFKRHRPDVVLSHQDKTIDWIEKAGKPVPGRCGFVLLNVILRTRPCAGLDLQPRQLGARAVELLAGQLQQNEMGSPAWPTSTMLAARWIEGPTIACAAESGSGRKSG